MEPDSKDIIKISPTDIKVHEPEVTPLTLIDKIISNGGDMAQVEMLMSLHERNEANQAKKAFHQAMADFKSNPPVIVKDGKVSYGNTKYNHASLGNVTSTINTSLSKHGLSATWKTDQEKGITVTCYITHVLGHQECTSLTAGAETSGAKNAIQAIGSTVTYLQRYTLLALTGLATQEQDDDGAGSQPDLMTKEQAEIIKERCDKEGIDAKDFAEAFGISRKESTKKEAEKFLKSLDNKVMQFIGMPD